MMRHHDPDEREAGGHHALTDAGDDVPEWIADDLASALVALRALS
jgi:hypothetical protein